VAEAPPAQAMDLLFDAPCSPPQSNASEDNNINDRPKGWSSWVSRQITAAYDEHASIIGALREELSDAKTREKALISEFTNRFRMMQESVPGTNKTFGELCPVNSYNITDDICYDDVDDTDDDDVDDDDEMPMDERAEASRIGNIAPSLGRLEQRRITEQFKEETYREMENMRKENEMKIQAIEHALKEKVEEIDRLRKESHGQRIDQHGGGVSSGGYNNLQQYNQIIGGRRRSRSRTRSPCPPRSPTSSPGCSLNPSDENFPVRSPTFNIPISPPGTPAKVQMSMNPRTWERSVPPMNRMRKTGTSTKNRPSSSSSGIIGSPTSSRFIVTPPGSPRSYGGDTIQGNYEHSLNNQYANSRDTTAHWELEESQMALDGSAIDNEKDLQRRSHPPIPVLKVMNIPTSAPDNIRHQQTGHSTETNILKNLQTAIDSLIFRQNAPDSLPVRLNEEELKFFERLKSIMLSSQKKQKHTIFTLKKGLEGTAEELKLETAQTAKLNKDLREHEDYIKELEKQLTSANDSLRNTTDLEDMLRMLGGDDQKEKELEHLSLKQKLQKVELERDSLLRQKDALNDDDNDKSVRAFERVLEDVTTEKNEAVGELTTQIDQLKDENGRLKNQLDGSTCDAIESNSKEILELRGKAKKTAALEQELSKVWEDLGQAKSQKEEAVLSLKKSKDMMRDLEEKYSSSNKENLMDTFNKREGLLIKKFGEKNTTTEGTSLKELEQAKERESIAVGENKELQEKLAKLEKLVVDLRKKTEDEDGYCEDLSSKVKAQEKTINDLKNDRASMELNLRDYTKRSESFEMKLDEPNSQIDGFKIQAAMAGEALKTAKGVHIREQKLEDELSELRSLLDKTMKGKTQLRLEIHEQSEIMNKLQKEHKLTINRLQIEIGKLLQGKTLYQQHSNKGNGKTDSANEVQVLQEKLRNTSHSNQVIRKNLREQQLLHDKLRLVSNWSSREILDQISAAASSSLCALESTTSPTSGTSNDKFELFSTKTASGKASPRMHILEENLKLLRVENEKIREDTSERDQELILLNTEMGRIKEEHLENVDLLKSKEEELQVLKESLNDASICYISGDESDSDGEEPVVKLVGAISLRPPNHARKNSYDKEMCANLINAKEEAEEIAKSNGESLANAKMIIASLEQSNKKMTQDLRSRLHDSNAALVSILEQSQKHEKDSVMLRAEIEKLKKEKENNVAISACDVKNDIDETEI